MQDWERVIYTLSVLRPQPRPSTAPGPGFAWDSTNLRLIFMNDSFIKCESSILEYWKKFKITEENK